MTAKPKTTLTLTCTIEQAMALNRATEFYARIGMGQWVVLAELFSEDRMLMASGERISLQALDDLRTAINGAKAIFGQHKHGSHAISNKDVHIDAQRNWELHKVIAQVLALHRDPEPTFSNVDYDGLRLRTTNDPAPLAKVGQV